ncbi:MAG: DUF1592 domain-containing protein [Rubripirellula sp.]
MISEMHRSNRILLWLACGIIWIAAMASAEPACATDAIPIDPFVATYFKQHCYQCHGEKKQKADRRLDQFPLDLDSNDEANELLEEVVDALNRGDMPPERKGVQQPTAEHTGRVIQWITQHLRNAARKHHSESTVLRRLNRFEYVNTMRDLLRIDTSSFDPTGDFPADATVDGLDNNGEALTLSDYQMQRYVEVAESFLDAAFFFGHQQPKPDHWHYTGKDFNGVRSYERAPVTWRLIVDDEILEVGHGQPSERHVNVVTAFAKQGGVPADGWYTIKVRAAAANRLDHGYDHAEFDRFKNIPLKMALWIAPEERLLEKNAADERRLLQVWDLPDGAPESFNERVWLRKGAIPFLSWTNGVTSKGNIRKVAEKHHPEVIRVTNTQRDAAELGDADAQSLVAKLSRNEQNKLLSEVYQGPRMRVWGMDIEGPTFDQWPPESHQVLFGDETDASKIDIEAAVHRFATRAFRRPISTRNIEHYVAFIQERISQGDDHAKAIKLGFAAILSSPRFLYLDEGNEESESGLNAQEIASRLSYFLWSSMPDAELIDSASTGELVKEEVIRQQVERMLRDPKASAFVEHFTDHWLRIDKLGSMPPAPKTFDTYYKDRLETFFKQETREFFADLLENNGSILHLIDSDYAFVNDALAKHYGIDGVEGEGFRKVNLEPKHHRGGLLGQGSVLTLTANGIETSPVVRGVWILENLLGTPPAPPPPDVEPLEPDTRGAITIRDQLSRHRTAAACADCHKKIDPAGFALEFYDPIGSYRSRYTAQRDIGPAVDGSGQLVTGEKFTDERGLKRLLLERKDRFAHTLTAKLLAYANGREMTFRDEAAIQGIAETCADSGYGLRDFVLAVATSPTFRSH